MSDDSHGVAQVGLNFQRGIQHLQDIGVTHLYYLKRSGVEKVVGTKAQLIVESIAVKDIDVQHHPVT